MPSVAEDIDVDLGQQIQMETAAASSVNPIAIRFAFFVVHTCNISYLIIINRPTIINSLAIPRNLKITVSSVFHFAESATTFW